MSCWRRIVRSSHSFFERRHLDIEPLPEAIFFQFQVMASLEIHPERVGRAEEWCRSLRRVESALVPAIDDLFGSIHCDEVRLTDHVAAAFELLAADEILDVGTRRGVGAEERCRPPRDPGDVFRIGLGDFVGLNALTNARKGAVDVMQFYVGASAVDAGDQVDIVGIGGQAGVEPARFDGAVALYEVFVILKM